MAYSHLFIMDPLKDLNMALDTSTRIAKSLADAGDTIYSTTVDDLAILPHGESACLATRLLWQDGHLAIDPSNPPPGELRELAFFSAIHMRKDPPLDDRYWTSTLILDRIGVNSNAKEAGRKCRVYNHPDALRRFNEKLLVFEFPEACAPAIVATQFDQILAFANRPDIQGDIIIKPLNLFGGRGVHRLQLTGNHTADMLALRENFYADQPEGFRIVQGFNQEIYAGEIRAFTAGGHAVSWCKKVPKTGSYLANTAAGAQLVDYEPSHELLTKVEKVATQLLAKGIMFIGFDIIGETISEINITSPRLLATNLSSEPFAKITRIIHDDLSS